MPSRFTEFIRSLKVDRATARQTFRHELLKWLVWGLPLTAIGAMMAWFFSQIAGALQAEIRGTLAGWLLAIGVALALVAAFGAWLLQRWRHCYSNDEFFGVDWTWSYTLGGRVTRIRAWCPACHREIAFRSGLMAALQTDNFLCNICGYDSFNRSPRETIPRPTISAVIRRIEEKRLTEKYEVTPRRT